MIRRLFDHLTGAHRCPFCGRRLSKRTPLSAHCRRKHVGVARGIVAIRALPADPDDGTGWSA